VPQRTSRLTQPRDNWPMVGRTGLSMAALEKSPALAGGDQVFSFEHSAQYQQVQFQFLEAVQSYNPQNIAVSEKRKLSETCEMRTPLGRANSVPNSEVSSFYRPICTENSSLEPDQVSLFHRMSSFCRVASHRFHCICIPY
jgi:hypothetical protein